MRRLLDGLFFHCATDVDDVVGDDAEPDPTLYATRIIPLDILFLFSLGAFLAIASAMLADTVRWPIALSSFPAWVWWLLPVVYIICDFAEDTVIFTMFRWPSTIREQALDALAHLRAFKIGTVTLSMAQVLLLYFASYIPAPRSGG